MTIEKATFGAGCFWGVEAAFRKVKGVVNTTVGYAGGHTLHPTYKQVCGGDTGHAEVVQVEFDPRLVFYEELLRLFWDMHDPTTYHRQGPDVGAQYRSVIFFHNASQEKAALSSKQEEQQKYKAKIVTEIMPAPPFYEAEEYHQCYLEKNKGPSCH